MQPHGQSVTSKSSDKALVAAFLAGDQQAFTLLLERYNGVILSKVAGVRTYGLEVDDLVQECALGLLDAVSGYRPEGSASFRTYAGVCIDNRLRSAFRRAGRMKNRIVSESVELTEDYSAAATDDPEKLMLARESAAEIRRFITELLTPTEYNVLMLNLSGKTYAETARQCGMSAKAVDNALQRVRRKLKDAVSHM